MINKSNWKLTKKYLEYRSSIDQITKGSLKAETTYIRYILEWADSIYFKKAPGIRPTFPEYVLKTRLGENEAQLSPASIKKALATARRFFIWLKENHRDFYSLKLIWINSIKAKRLIEIPRNTEAVSLKEILAIASAPTENLVERRIRASAVFLFLSGMRIGAFVSLPIKAIDIPNRIILQDPRLGVRTKNRKYGKTTFLEIPELINLILEWDQEVRAVLPEDGFWFAPLRPDTGEIDTSNKEFCENRGTLATKNLKAWLNKIGLTYHSPHKFRHGHIHYATSHAQTIEEYKAISLNVMHSSMEITDQFYSNLNDGEIKEKISSLGKNKIQTNDFTQEEILLLKGLLTQIRA